MGIVKTIQVLNFRIGIQTQIELQLQFKYIFRIKIIKEIDKFCKIKLKIVSKCVNNDMYLQKLFS